MTEAEWNACDNPQQMLQFLRGKVGARKLRLFAVGSCRQFRDTEEDDRFVQAVTVAERYADGLGSKAALWRARQLVKAARHAPIDSGQEKWAAYWLAEVTASVKAVGTLADEIERLITEGLVPSSHRLLGCSIVRCVFTFHPPTINKRWRSAPVTSLAEAIYTDRAFDRLPILADALEDAGCTDPDILAHCRGPGPHVRGCWVVDLLTGRE